MKKDKGRHTYAFVRTLLSDGSHAVEEDEDDDVDEILQDFHQGQLSLAKR